MSSTASPRRRPTRPARSFGPFSRIARAGREVLGQLGAGPAVRRGASKPRLPRSSPGRSGGHSLGTCGDRGLGRVLPEAEGGCAHRRGARSGRATPRPHVQSLASRSRLGRPSLPRAPSSALVRAPDRRRPPAGRGARLVRGEAEDAPAGRQRRSTARGRRRRRVHHDPASMTSCLCGTGSPASFCLCGRPAPWSPGSRLAELRLARARISGRTVASSEKRAPLTLRPVSAGAT